MYYYEILVADLQFKSDKPLTYQFDQALAVGTIVTIPLRSRYVTGFIISRVNKPKFETKPIKNNQQETKSTILFTKSKSKMADLLGIKTGVDTNVTDEQAEEKKENCKINNQ